MPSTHPLAFFRCPICKACGIVPFPRRTEQFDSELLPESCTPEPVSIKSRPRKDAASNSGKNESSGTRDSVSIKSCAGTRVASNSFNTECSGKMKTNGTAAKCMYCFHETRTCMAGMVSRVDFTLSDGSWGTIDRKLWRRAPSSIIELHFHMRDNRVCYTTYLPPPTNRVPPPPSSTGFDMSELSSALSSVTGDCESDTEDLKNFLADSDSSVIYSLYADM